MTETPICLPTIEKTGRVELTVKLSESEYFGAHMRVQYAGVQRQKAYVMFVFSLTHPAFLFHCVSELQHNDLCQLLPRVSNMIVRNIHSVYTAVNAQYTADR